MIRKLWALCKRDALIDLSYPMPFATQWIAIVVGVTALYYVSKLVHPSHLLGAGGRSASYFSYAVVNVAFMVVQTSAVQAFANTLRRDQMIHLVEPIFATPTPVEIVVLGSGIWKIALSVAQAVVYLTVATAFYGLQLGATNVGALVFFAALSLLCMASLGMIGAGVVVYSKQAPPSNFIVGGAASMLAGVLFPVALLPEPLRVVSWMLPITHALAGMRGAIAGLPLERLAGDALWLGCAAAILIPLALAVFGFCVTRARTDGTLAHY